MATATKSKAKAAQGAEPGRITGIQIPVWRVVGEKPGLLLNNAAPMLVKQEEGIKTKPVYDDEEEARKRLYLNERGEFVFLTAGFRAGILRAAVRRKIGKSPAREVLAGCVFPVEEEFIILDEKGEPVRKYEIDKRRVVNPTNKAAVLRCRPKFYPWACLLPMEVDMDFIQNLDMITEMLNVAGRTVGIGDFRPDTTKGKSGIGRFGRYRAELVKRPSAPGGNGSV